jgi:selenocysteine lyase/cysteine desulfurase
MLPTRDQFPGLGVTYLDGATQHPVPRGARQAAMTYLDARSFAGSHRGTSGMDVEGRVCALFARLINARTEEIAVVPSTIAGEQLVIRALGLRAGDRIVTDALHFPGSSCAFLRIAD